jgi:hypothetical protein
MMFFFRKLFKVPTPSQLGKGKYCDALPMRDFSNPGDYCWEDYYEEIAQKFPIRNFFGITLPDFIKYKIWFRIWVPYNTLYQYLVSHLVPSQRYHMLDLRQPCDKNQAVNFDCYRYGWVDVPERMLYAMFNLLDKYIEENPYALSYEYSQWEVENTPDLQHGYELQQETKAILHWWKVERKESLLNLEKMSKELVELADNKDKLSPGEYSEKCTRYHQAKEDLETKADEMLIRLIKIRRELWT